METTETRTIGRQIADARQLRSWTQRQLGEQIGIGASLVAKWEQGSRVPPFEWLAELDRVLGTDMSANAAPTPRRRGPRPAVARPSHQRSTAPAPGVPQPVLVEITEDGVKVFQGDQEIDAVVVDLREFQQATASERVKRTSELLLRTLELPRPLADRVVRRIADLP
ncbi:MAG: helix-turn-helix transcriptional regulator [Actinobacteria bacterium]|nr:helix-turn-helix transcriptional regulator [Actinomycetota bacterium]